MSMSHLYNYDVENMIYVLSCMEKYTELNKTDKFKIDPTDLAPIITRVESDAGLPVGQYYHQDLWAARKIYERRPKRHMDIGSRIDGFISHLLVFMPIIDVVDIKEIQSNDERLRFYQANATDLSLFKDNTRESLSSLHVVEHFGLGRYRDPIDPYAYIKAMNEMYRILKPGGYLYFSVPVGRERVQFNAHRIFDPTTILNCFKKLKLLSFSAVDDDGNLDLNTTMDKYKDANYSCGLFEFMKER